MAANHSQPSDRISEEKPVESDILKDQPLSAKNGVIDSPDPSQDVSTFGQQRESNAQFGSFGSPGDRAVYPPNVYAPQAQAFFYRGYENAIGEWDEYPPYVNAEGLEIGSPSVYNDNGSIVYHAGYGYGPQMPYGPYSPVTTPIPSVGGDGQLHSPQQFPFSGPPYFQQMGHPSSPYITSSSPQPEMNTLASIDQQGDNMFFGPRPSFPPQAGPFGRGNISGNFGAHGVYDLQQGFDGSRSSGLWSDWPKPSDRHRSLAPLSPAVSPQPISPYGSYGQNVGMGRQQQRSFYGIDSSSNSYARGYARSDFNQASRFGSASISSFGTNSRNWVSIENTRRQGRASISLCGCNSSVDILGEQNRGPRASKPKSQSTADHTSLDNNKYRKPIAKISVESYNQSDFDTDYKDAKFFIIKSYSEDNVHKSIKYGVWASTPNGNRKLDAAYHEAKEKQEPMPVFLLFSVNASAQFCGVAEMVGPVDFDKSVDYWQQDKWSGQFPVKWHIIKDVPNSQFRHIVLENNDNKPVTNSRDTQEVKLELGIEMLSIYKNYETEMSILDDFEFYEERQKAMQERKARQQASLIGAGPVENEHRNAGALPENFMKHMSKSFAQVVRVDESNKEGPVADRGSSNSDSSGRVKVEDGITSVSSGKAS